MILLKTDVVFNSTELKDLEATVRTLLEVTSWRNWWFYIAKSLCDTSEKAKVQHLLVVSARMQLLVAKTASTIWANSTLKWCDAMLGKVKDNISFELFIELCNGLLSGSTELFPQGALQRAAK